MPAVAGLLVRPDQFVAQLSPMDEADALRSSFDGFMRPARQARAAQAAYCGFIQ